MLRDTRTLTKCQQVKMWGRYLYTTINLLSHVKEHFILTQFYPVCLAKCSGNIYFCEISILLFLVHRISRYSSYPPVSIGAPQHNWLLPHVPCHSQRLDIHGSYEEAHRDSLQSCPCADVGVSNPAAPHVRQHRERSPYPRWDRHKAVWQQQQPPPAVPMGSKAGSGSSAQQNEVLVMGLYLSKTLSLLSVLVGGGVEWLISN